MNPAPKTQLISRWGGPLCGWWRGGRVCVEGVYGIHGGEGTTRAGKGGFACFAPKPYKAPRGQRATFCPTFLLLKKWAAGGSKIKKSKIDGRILLRHSTPKKSTL